MTRDKLIDALWQLTEREITVDRCLTAVDAYCAAQIAQSQCSRLREILVMMLNSEDEAALHTCDSAEFEEAHLNMDAIKVVLKLMDEVYPGA